MERELPTVKVCRWQSGSYGDDSDGGKVNVAGRRAGGRGSNGSLNKLRQMRTTNVGLMTSVRAWGIHLQCTSSPHHVCYTMLNS